MSCAEGVFNLTSISEFVPSLPDDVSKPFSILNYFIIIKNIISGGTK